MAFGSDTTCNMRNGPSDSGQSIVAKILQGAAIAAAAYNTTRAVSIATDQWKMAKNYWQLSQYWLDHYRNNYAPVEDQELAEALAIPIETPQYETARGRHRAVAMLGFKGKVHSAIRVTSEYHTGLRKDMLVDLSTAQAHAVALADGLGYRNERAYVESRNDVRFDKMLNTAKRGRDMVADNVSLAKTTAQAYGSAYEQAWEGLQGSAYFLGYQSRRNPTYYPTTYVDNGETTQNPSAVNIALAEIRAGLALQSPGLPPVSREVNNG